MNKIKVIDLLNMFSKGEEIPKYIKYYDRLHQKEDTMMCCYNNIIYKLDNNIIDLLDEVEILEEEKKIPEKLNVHYDRENRFQVKVDGKTTTEVMCLKINEIIDYLDYLKSKGE